LENHKIQSRSYHYAQAQPHFLMTRVIMMMNVRWRGKENSFTNVSK